jgi:hypothetical protein
MSWQFTTKERIIIYKGGAKILSQGGLTLEYENS